MWLLFEYIEEQDHIIRYAYSYDGSMDGVIAFDRVLNQSTIETPATKYDSEYAISRQHTIRFFIQRVVNRGFPAMAEIATG